MIGRLVGAVTGAGAESVSKAVVGAWATIKGDQSARDQQLHAEQVAVLEAFAGEFAGRAPETWWDSFVDGMNRLPRPMITFSIIGVFLWAIIDPAGFVQYMQAMQVVPDELWTMWLAIVAFWFGGRLFSQDMRKPKLTRDQVALAAEIMRARIDAGDRAEAGRVAAEDGAGAARAPAKPGA